MINNMIWVGLGGLLGCVARYLCVLGVGRLFPSLTFPLGTLLVNVLGCLAIGFIGALASDKQIFEHTGRLFLLTGILGGFTTFSAFGLETFYLLRSAQWILAFANILLQVFLGLGSVAIGCWLAKFF